MNVVHSWEVHRTFYACWRVVQYIQYTSDCAPVTTPCVMSTGLTTAQNFARCEGSFRITRRWCARSHHACRTRPHDIKPYDIKQHMKYQAFCTSMERDQLTRWGNCDSRNSDTIFPCSFRHYEAITRVSIGLLCSRRYKLHHKRSHFITFSARANFFFFSRLG